VIVGIGMDVVEIARIARILEKDYAPRFLARCFSPGEQSYCEGYGDRAARYAARLAAKEAVVKALGAPAGVGWGDVVVERPVGGAPRIRLYGEAQRLARERGVGPIHLTLTHDGGIAAATVVLESERAVP
jgi:holo-[acyl-carrier protein] synthase